MKYIKLSVLATFVIAITALFSSCNQPKVESEWIQLFNGEDLTGLTPKIVGYELGDNYGNTFRVEDGMIKVRVWSVWLTPKPFRSSFLQGWVFTLQADSGISFSWRSNSPVLPPGLIETAAWWYTDKHPNQWSLIRTFLLLLKFNSLKRFTSATQ